MPDLLAARADGRVARLPLAAPLPARAGGRGGPVSLILWGWALALFPSVIYLFRVFKREPARS